MFLLIFCLWLIIVLKLNKHMLFILLFTIFLSQERICMAKNNNEIILPNPRLKGEISVEEAILKRRSQRSFLNKDLDLSQISQLLWSAQGVTLKKGGFSFRSAPSAGALYPMEIYILNTEGIYHYSPLDHKLILYRKGDFRSHLSIACWGQRFVAQAPLDIVICAVYSRVTRRYGQRGIRYVHIEAGHIAQNIHLQAVALGLGSVPVGAFDDEQVKDLLMLKSEEEPLYIIPVGYPE